MVFYFNFWHQRLQNGLCIVEKIFNILSEFYSNLRLGTKPSKTFHKGLDIVEKWKQKSKQKEE